MKYAILIAAAAALAQYALAQSSSDAEREILALERKVLDGWQKGEPDPLLATLDPEVTYFHVVTDERLEGRAAVAALVEGYRGRPLFDRYEIAAPKVRSEGNIAVFTYILVTHNGDAVRRWNGTQVYRRTAEGWRAIHIHWSLVRGSRT